MTKNSKKDQPSETSVVPSRGVFDDEKSASGSFTFIYTGAPESYIVGPTHDALQIVAVGGRGGAGGFGGHVSVVIPKPPTGTVLEIRVGGTGLVGESFQGPTMAQGGAGGYNGGGKGGNAMSAEVYAGNGGGGATEITLGNKSIVIAAGGGGGAYGTSGGAPGKDGAGSYGGKGASATVAGAGGGSGSSGQASQGGQGGTGPQFSASFGGGGGGGGRWGGGGGGDTQWGHGGGGGSNFVPANAQKPHTQIKVDTTGVSKVVITPINVMARGPKDVH